MLARASKSLQNVLLIVSWLLLLFPFSLVWGPDVHVCPRSSLSGGPRSHPPTHWTNLFITATQKWQPVHSPEGPQSVHGAFSDLLFAMQPPHVCLRQQRHHHFRRLHVNLHCFTCFEPYTSKARIETLAGCLSLRHGSPPYVLRTRVQRPDGRKESLSPTSQMRVAIPREQVLKNRPHSFPVGQVQAYNPQQKKKNVLYFIPPYSSGSIHPKTETLLLQFASSFFWKSDSIFPKTATQSGSGTARTRVKKQDAQIIRVSYLLCHVFHVSVVHVATCDPESLSPPHHPITTTTHRPTSTTPSDTTCMIALDSL